MDKDLKVEFDKIIIWDKAMKKLSKEEIEKEMDERRAIINKGSIIIQIMTHSSTDEILRHWRKRNFNFLKLISSYKRVKNIIPSYPYLHKILAIGGIVKANIDLVPPKGKGYLMHKIMCIKNDDTPHSKIEKRWVRLRAYLDKNNNMQKVNNHKSYEKRLKKIRMILPKKMLSSFKEYREKMRKKNEDIINELRKWK